MNGKYTAISGLSFPKGSDREYIEHWENISEAPLIRKTICGDIVLVGRELTSLTISGKGDIQPKCTLKIGDMVSVKSLKTAEQVSFRFDKWGVKYSPWEFQYAWTYTFTEVTS